ncbi:MAG TPA: hypothetical protein DEP84_23075, partial [Chloroflexi bacterium]|nr:hypothetical protein [Chloroflexota bacterium]
LFEAKRRVERRARGRGAKAEGQGAGEEASEAQRSQRARSQEGAIAPGEEPAVDVESDTLSRLRQAKEARRRRE